MLLIVLIVGLSALRFLEIGVFAELSWWWIGARKYRCCRPQLFGQGR